MDKETFALNHKTGIFTKEIPTKDFTVVDFELQRVTFAVSPRDYYVDTSKNKWVGGHIHNGGASYVLFWVWLEKCGVYTPWGVVSLPKRDFETKGTSNFSKDWKFSEKQIKDAIEDKWSITYLSGVTERCKENREKFLSAINSGTKL